MKNTWYMGEITSTCHDYHTMEMLTRSCEGMETMDEEELTGWYDFTKNGVVHDMEILESEDAFDVRVQTEEQDLPDDTKEKCVWKWLAKETNLFFTIELVRWQEERY